MEDKKKELPTTRMIDKISEGAELMRNIIICDFELHRLENYLAMRSEKPIKDDFFYLNL